MPFRIELYVLAAEDVERMEACFRPPAFVSRDIDRPVAPAKAREWLESCTPLLERLGDQASAELLTRVKQLRERGPGYDLEPGDRDKTRQFHFNLNVHGLFYTLAAEYLQRGTRHLLTRTFTLYLHQDDAWVCFERIHFDRKPLVPTIHAVFNPPRGRAFASSPLSHTASGSYYIWRGPEHLRAFFASPEDPLTPPTPEQVVAFKNKLRFWATSKEKLEAARQNIRNTQGAWNVLVEVLRTAEQCKGAFLSQCKDITPYD